MAIRTKKPVKTAPKVKDTSYESTHDLKKLKLYVVIVDRGLGTAISYLMQKYSSAVQFISVGNGTAKRQFTDILGIEDNSKDIIFSILQENKISDMVVDLNEFFSSSKKNRGIGFSIKMTSMIGVKLYEFLADAKE